MSVSKPKGLVGVTVVYWVMLIYIVSALLWWFIALERQNHEVSNIRLKELSVEDPAYASKTSQINDTRKRKTTQYIGEGSTFLALILLGAVYVFRVIRRQLKLSIQQQNFMMAVTHELKTPIAITQLNLETLQKRKLDEDKQQKLITNTLQEANRLNNLCNNILLAAQLEANAYATTKQEINFSDLVGGCVDDFKNRFPQRLISEQITPALYLTGENLLLQMMVNNLMENAMKYSPKDSLITLAVGTQNRQLVFRISDEGMGIPDAEKQKIFTKFYRIGNENTRTTKGTGLGLYLCSKIVRGHRGSIAVSDNQPRGTIVTVTLPLA